MSILVEALPELIATLVGVAVGGVGALFANRRAELFRKRKRAEIVLRNISQELLDGYNAMKAALPAFEQASGGVNFYISTIAWETAVASGDLPEIIGFELADEIENQYSTLFHLRYYLEQFSAVTLAAADTPGQATLKQSYRGAIIKGLKAAMQRHPAVIARIEAEQR